MVKFTEKRLKMIKQWYADNITNDEITDILMTVRFLIHQMEEIYEEDDHPSFYETLDMYCVAFNQICRHLPDYPFYRGWNLNES
mgnify:CR=1 FL=1|tara:strand:+ start:252 stop:503 length:252 start_codon:yes stop_codon:yes gene_type:complete